MTATFLFPKRHGLRPRNPLRYLPDTFSVIRTSLSRDHEGRHVQARQDIAPVHRRVVPKQGRGALAAHHVVLLQGPGPVLSAETLREHAAEHRRRRPVHVPPQLKDHARGEPSRELPGLLGRPRRVGGHARGLVHQDEARDEFPGLGREDVEEGPDDGAAHRVRHDADARQLELREEVQEVCRVPVDAVAEAGLVRLSVPAVVVCGDAMGRLEVRHLFVPLGGGCPPSGDEEEVLARGGSGLCVGKTDAVVCRYEAGYWCLGGHFVCVGTYVSRW